MADKARHHPPALDATGRSTVGAPLPRLEDQRLLTGQGRYVDDLIVRNVAYAYVVRSPHAHARIRSIGKSAALAAPGVLLVLTGEDVLKEKLRPLRCASFPKTAPGSASYCPTQPILATDKVRHVGDRVALIVADTLTQAKDAAELLEVDYEALPAVSLDSACAQGTAKVWDEAQSNVSFEMETGDRKAVEQQFAAAAHVTKIAVHYPRASANTMEPRGALATRDPIDGRYTLCSSTQNPFRARETVCDVLGMPQLNLRVKTMDVGGSFGMKGQTYPEDVLVVWAAGKLSRPVKWTAERSEAIASDMHGRHQIAEAAIALDRDGHVLGFRTVIAIDVGAYLSNSAGVPPHNAGISYPSTYHVPMTHSIVRATFTNASQTGPYRGSAKPEASFVLERLIEKAARELGIDPIEMRRRNFIRSDAMPYKALGGYIYDSGNFERALDTALTGADWHGFAARRQASEARHRRRGIGIAMHCQRAGTASERMEIRIDQDGSVALYVGTLSTGQGHETMFAQMASEWLGVPVARVRLFQGDTDRVLFGRGSFAQRSMSAGGSALKVAADEVIKKGKRLSAWMLEAAEADIVFDRGIFRVVGTDRKVTLAEVARKSYLGAGLPSGLGIGLDSVGTHPGPNTYPNGCMVCEVEVDPDTGVIAVDRIFAVDDVGAVVNPLTLEGQLHGSIAQGLGESLVEEVIYERGSGQLLSGSFMDYAMPRADIMPEIESALSLAPTGSNLLGVKGGSEAGNVATPAAIINAAIDALSFFGVTDLPLPATPERVWRAIREASGGPA